MRSAPNIWGSSPDYVFSGNGRQQLTEEDPVGPLNHYGMTKLEGEQRLQKVMPSATILRTSWVFGRGGKNFVAKSLQLLQAQKEILLVDDQWGRPTFAPDLAAVILQMQGQSGLYHFANEGVVTKYGFGLAVKEEALALGIPMENETILPIPSANFPSPCKRPAYTPLDTSKIEKKLGLTPRSWRECLREYLVDYAPVAPAR
jgi:dTDP-4-dehydrorhamnose reductase